MCVHVYACVCMWMCVNVLVRAYVFVCQSVHFGKATNDHAWYTVCMIKRSIQSCSQVRPQYVLKDKLKWHTVKLNYELSLNWYSLFEIFAPWNDKPEMGLYYRKKQLLMNLRHSCDCNDFSRWNWNMIMCDSWHPRWNGCWNVSQFDAIENRTAQSAHERVADVMITSKMTMVVPSLWQNNIKTNRKNHKNNEISLKKSSL